MPEKKRVVNDVTCSSWVGIQINNLVLQGRSSNHKATVLLGIVICCIKHMNGLCAANHMTNNKTFFTQFDQSKYRKKSLQLMVSI